MYVTFFTPYSYKIMTTIFFTSEDESPFACPRYHLNLFLKGNDKWEKRWFESGSIR